MNLELLANELLLDIFDYFPAVQLLRTFHRLNTRFDNLILTYFQKHRLDFRAAAKQDFELVCRENLPLITDQIISLGLSDDDEIPQQISLFRLYNYNLNQFQYLRSLSLEHVRAGEIISEILFECPQLIHLNLTSCYFGRRQGDINHFVNIIWTLPKLIYCYLNLNFKYGFNMSTPTNVSLTMEHLSILGVSCRIGQMTHFCEHTPRLRYLALDLSDSGGSEQIRTPILSINQLNLVFVGVQNEVIENLLQHVPNLYQLKIETCYVEMNGNEWEEIIRNYLPKLKVFQLKMRFRITQEKYKKELFKSFQTRFWLEEHQWFVQYHYNLEDNSNMICLYTLPYSFSYLDMIFPMVIKSTCPKNENFQLYDHVQHLDYRSSSTNEETIVSNLYFPNINYLSVTLPINNHLLSIIQKLCGLSSLEVSRSKNMSDVDAQLQLQNILNHAPYLHSLNFKSWRETQQSSSMGEKLTPVILNARLIRRVNLRGYDWWFNDEECIAMSDSPLGQQCEVLFIKVQNRKNILYLINSMHNLRALIVQSRDDIWANYSTSTQDAHVQWLEQNLPSTCSIKRDFRFIHSIRIWI